MQDNLIIDKIPKTNTFSSKLLNIDSNVFPDKPQLNSKQETKDLSGFLESEEENKLLLNESSFSNNSQNSQNSKSNATIYILMFFNICRSFIAIGVLAIPFGLSKIGK